ncbi:UNVERIFIED_CONTAM: hypothetical protein Sindi_2655300 [Sesamum indicum]
MLNTAIWNVRGLNKRDHQLAVQDIVAEFRLQLLGLLETRVRINNVAAIQSFLLPNWKWFVDYGMVGNRIWIAWDDNFIDVDVVECGTQFIHCLVYIRSIRESIAITMIYGATEVADRRELWGSLETIAMQTGDIPWLIGGDFNAVRDISEICGASGDVRMAMEEFNDCIQNAGLLPLPMQGEWYTWHNCSASPWNLWKRLDRMMINDRWMARFPTSFYTSLTPRTPDHSPLVLYGDSQQQYGGMFRFDNYLTLSPEFIPSVQQVWQHNIIGAPMYAVTRKLKALKQVFREQRRNKGDLSHNVQLAKGFLEMAQLLVSSNRHDELLLQLEHCCRFILAKAAKLEQSILQQRAKMQWMKGGDQCSRVFFRKIAQRRSARRILQINDDHGATHTEPQETPMSEEDVNSLLLPFTPADVKQAVFDIAEDKAPGPDGYSSGFFKAAWPIVGQEVTSAVLDFFNTGRLLKQINTTLLALIPKVHTPMTVGDFRPISCCNVLYKTIAKLLVQRLSVILDKIISPCQAAFVPGRSIGDNIMLAQELFTGYNQARLPPRCALKVDIRKAYDTVEWDFMIAVMELFGFPPNFVKWIEMCVTTTSFSVGLNGKPHGFFKGARGLRQGDPLSPYLFVLVMEVLHLSFLQLIDQDELFSFHWKCDSARVFQLGFADDLLLFCHADMDSIGVFKIGLDRFAVWSGLRLNVQKSHLIISRSAQGLRDEMLTALGFQEGVLPMRYLGLPLLSSRLTIADCRPLLMKIEKRIAGWEGIALSYAGRVQIIKSVLMALSLYWASAFILPKKVTNEIEKRLRTFLWKGTSTSGYAKVAWKDLCRPKEEGGLGFKDITLLNRALMAKKLCDIIRCDRTSIWVTWLYQDRLRDTSIWTISEHGGSWGWRKLLRLRIFLRSMVDYKIGDGRRFYLWQDPWHHLGPLRDTFPRGPRLLRLEESTKLCTVISGGEWQWPPITDFECLEITHTLPTIYGGEDHIIWRFDHGIPTTQTLYRLFDPPGPKVDWYSLLSGSLKIPRHLFILWLAILGKLATTDKPWLVHLGPCILCNDGATETHDRLFFQCRFSRQDWMTDIIWASRRWRGQHIINMSYRALLASCVYHIWKERNLRRFEQTERTPSTMAVVIIEDIKQRIHSITLPSSVSTRSLFRLWRIPWPEASHLLSPFSPEKVKLAVFDIEEDKAPGRDGYSSGFYKASWPVVGAEVTRAVLDFFSTGRLLKQVNSTLGSDSKGSYSYVSFIPGRSIGDNIMLAQELFTGYNQARLPPRCALKVDIRKAYDTFEWDFLVATLHLFGFPPTFTSWIEECIATASFSIGLNGTPHGFFTGARGLRQGDPLSPYLFVLVMEVLHLGLSQLIEQDLRFTFHWKCEPARIFQLGFADDLILFCKADKDSIRTLKVGLDRFAEWSGLRLNIQKSHLIISPVCTRKERTATIDIGLPGGAPPNETTAVGYFLGKRPYFHHLKEFVMSVWPELKEVTGTNNGFFFLQFKSVAALKDVIEGGPWLFQGQLIVLQKWEPGMVLRKLQHTQVPVWIKLRHLPVEFWTEEGLSTVASGVGKPLYPDAITRACTRLDFARVCVMLDVTSNLPKHIVIMNLDEDGGESPCKVDVEYEWLPQRCKSCMTLGHSAKDCVLNKPKPAKPPIAVYVPKVGTLQESTMPERSRNHPREDDDTTYIPSRPPHMSDRNKSRPPPAPVVEKQREEREYTRDTTGPSREERGKALVKYNTFDALHLLDDTDESTRGPKHSNPIPSDPYHQLAVKDNIAEFRLQFLDLLETRVRINNVAQIQSFLLPNWKWYVDYRSSVADTVAYGGTEVADRRELWSALENLAIQCADIPWLIGGNFNAVCDLNEVCGTSRDIRIAMEDFNVAIQNKGLLPLPMQGEWYTWHNHSATQRNLWKRLDRMSVNDRWMARFPNTFYSVLTPRISDHSRWYYMGTDSSNMEFIPSVQNIWQHNIIGTPMYAVIRKLKALKPIFREQRRNKGNLSHNVQMAKGFLEAARLLVNSRWRDELYIQLEHCC